MFLLYNNTGFREKSQSQQMQTLFRMSGLTAKE